MLIGENLIFARIPYKRFIFILPIFNGLLESALLITARQMLKLSIDYMLPTTFTAEGSIGSSAINPDYNYIKIELKNFHCEIVNNHDILKQQEDAFVSICKVREITPEMIHQNYNEIKQDIQDIIHTEIERLLNDPAKRYMVIQKK